MVPTSFKSGWISAMMSVVFYMAAMLTTMLIALIMPMLLPVACLGWWFAIRYEYPRAPLELTLVLAQIGAVFSNDEVGDGFEVSSGEDEDLLHDKNMVNVKVGRKIHYAARVALLAKAQVGLMSNNRASQLVYQRICRDEMVKHGVRPTHLARLLPLAVASCFIMTDEDRLAAEIMRSVEAHGGGTPTKGFLLDGSTNSNRLWSGKLPVEPAISPVVDMSGFEVASAPGTSLPGSPGVIAPGVGSGSGNMPDRSL